MSNDQWFQPGDKVMRVAGNTKNGSIYPTNRRKPRYGEILCVEDFWEGPNYNVVMFVGFGGWAYDHRGWKVGWPASAFRKVDEIKLIVEAVEKGRIEQEKENAK